MVLHVPVDLMSRYDDGGNGVKAAVPSDGGGPKHVSQPGVVGLVMRLFQSNNGVCSSPANPFAVPPHFSQPPGLKGSTAL